MLNHFAFVQFYTSIDVLHYTYNFVLISKTIYHKPIFYFIHIFITLHLYVNLKLILKLIFCILCKQNIVKFKFAKTMLSLTHNEISKVIYIVKVIQRESVFKTTFVHYSIIVRLIVIINYYFQS